MSQKIFKKRQGNDNSLMPQKVWLIALSIILTVSMLLIFFSGRLSAPQGIQSRAELEDGQEVSVAGEIICLPHRDQSGPHTLECAYGFKAEDGTYYQLSDPTSNSSLLASAPMNEKVTIKGHYSTDADSKYLQNGKIELTEINR